MSEQVSSSDEDLGDDEALLRAVARGPRVEHALAQVRLPDALRPALEREGTEAPSPTPGAVLDGRYRVDARLGAGGMGIVFSATHLQTQKRVALKWMQARFAASGGSEAGGATRRFEREARIAGRVRHPNVVDVYDASSDGRRAYLVMELLHGETLAARMQRGALDWDAALALLLPAMRGVAALHAAGIVHRDLKPENIYLADAGDGSGALCPKVLDFGVAALRENEPGAHDEALTRPGAVLGTPAYMPLEQLRGQRALDERTDVYAVGVVLYEALSGRRPFQAGNAAEHAALLASSAPVPLGRLVPALRGPRERAVMKALARDPGDRYRSVEGFSAALQRAAPSRRVLRVALLLFFVTMAALSALLRRGTPDLQTRRASWPSTPPAPAEKVETTPAASSPAALEVAPPAASTPGVQVPKLTRPSSTRPRARHDPAPQAPADRATRLSRDDF